MQESAVRATACGRAERARRKFHGRRFTSPYRVAVLVSGGFKLKTRTNKPTLLCKVSRCAVLLQET
eukprot:3044772-Prymnesium_polylepis.1